MKTSFFVGLALLAALGCTESDSKAAAVRVWLPEGGIIIGAEDAPVVLLEFGSFDCAFCQYLHEAVFPAVVNPYVARGGLKVRYVDLSASRRGRGLAASLECSLAFMPGRDLGRVTRGFAFAGDDFAFAFGPAHGIIPEVLRACIADNERERRRTAERVAAANVGIRGTPTIIIGYQKTPQAMIGWPLAGVPEQVRLAELIDSALVLVGGADRNDRQ